MPSLIPGYQYDIFISYRQKDNKYDGWVTEFVANLKKEIEATFKEDISVYFDINPHDGLLEAYDVDASLKEKLKCLIFIPIISRIYCDPKSFAWEHEFKTFVEWASQDQFGLKVKLPNGNVASRVLPVRIHDLDSADIRLCEQIVGGVLRGIEFVYEEPGVNRPLTPADDENKNLKKTRYRNQINKAALTINEIVQGLMTEPEWQKFEKRIEEEEFRQTEESVEKESAIKMKASGHKTPRKLIPGTLVVAILAAVLFFTWTKIFNKSPLDKLRSSGERISVAVMPFVNMTNDTIWNVWQDGIQNELITSLTNSEELKVRQVESISSLLQSEDFTSYTSLTPSIASKISQKLDASIFLYGTIKQAGATIRLNAQLIDSKTEEAFKSFEINGPAKEDITFQIIDSLKRMVKNFLIISVLKKEVTPDFQPYMASTNSPEAFKYYLLANRAAAKWEISKAREYLLQALKIDSNYFAATIDLSWSFSNQGMHEEGKKVCLKVYEKRDQMPEYLRICVDYLYANYFMTPREMIKCLLQLLDFDDQSAFFYIELGWNYNRLYQYDKAIPALEKSLEIYKKWGTKPYWDFIYRFLGSAYHETGQIDKEKELYKKAERDFPNDWSIINLQATLALSERDTAKANNYIKQYISLRKDGSASEADIAYELGGIYYEADILDKAEEYYAKSVSLEPDNPGRMNSLAYFLIDKDRNIREGMELINKALSLLHELKPDDYYYLHTKGLGLYKQGKYKEALNLLEKSDLLKPIYDHDLFLHLEAAKKAVLK